MKKKYQVPKLNSSLFFGDTTEKGNETEKPISNALEVSDVSKRSSADVKLLGRGSFGNVYSSDSDPTIAIKKANGHSESAESISNEIAILSHLNEHKSDNIIEMIDYDDKRNLFFTMPRCTTTLDEYLKQAQVSIEEKKDIFRQVVQGLHDMHQPHDGHLVVHRDLKLENILVKVSNDKPPIIKLADFGASKRIKKGDLLKGDVGTQRIMPPEMYGYKSKDGYSEKVDVWMLGCALIEILSGKKVWKDENYSVVSFAFTPKPPQYPDDFDETAKHFLNQCLIINPNERPSVQELMNHPFLTRN